MVFPIVHFKDLMVHGTPLGTVGTALVLGGMVTEFLFIYEILITLTKCSEEQLVLVILGNHETLLSILKEKGDCHVDMATSLQP